MSALLGGPLAGFLLWFRSSCLESRLSTAVAGRVTVAVLNVLVPHVWPRGGLQATVFLSPEMSDIGFGSGGCI